MPTAQRAPEAEAVYREALDLLRESGLPFLVGGAFCLREYAGIERDTKDLDIFCKPGDYEKLLTVFGDAGYEIEITDANWLAKAFKGEHYIDLIFNSANGLSPVDDGWFEHAKRCALMDTDVPLAPAEEVLCTKMFVQDRVRCDDADVLHIFRKSGPELDWERLLGHMDLHWEVLLAHILNFRYVYPSERENVPSWLVRELLGRLEQQLDGPVPKDRICRGRNFSRIQYEVDITEWGYIPR